MQAESIEDRIEAQSTEKIAYRKTLLHQEFIRDFQPNAIGRTWLIPSVKRSLKSYRLKDLDAWDVLIEAYSRAMNHVSQGKLIWNLVSWMRSAATLIIYEERRKAGRLDIVYTDADLYYCNQNFPTGIVLDIDEAATFLVNSIMSLEAFERKLIIWRVVEQHSWREIQKMLEEEGRSVPSLPLLRKRKERALLKLRKRIPRWKITDYYRIFAEEHALFCQVFRLNLLSASRTE
jgi:DNA-directed RNA polymerase specialized sigma24 family protein